MVSGTVATAYQAVRRASIEVADNVIVFVSGGIGQHIVQTAKALGAGVIIAVDSVESRLKKMIDHGADFTINAADIKPDEVVAEVGRIRYDTGLPDSGWKVFETTGSVSARQTALAHLQHADKLVITGCATQRAGYDPDPFGDVDAEIVYSWGCLPEYYPLVLDLVTSGRIAVSPFVLTRPMSWIREVFEELRRTPSDIQYILTPDDFGLDTYPEPKSCR